MWFYPDPAAQFLDMTHIPPGDQVENHTQMFLFPCVQAQAGGVRTPVPAGTGPASRSLSMTG